MKKLLFCVCLLAVIWIAAPARGSLGENDAQMTARYGAEQAVEKNTPDGLATKCYSHGGMWIRARFLDGGSASEAFINLSKEPLTAEAIAALLESNRRGSTWKEIYKSADVQRWVLESNGAVAQYYPRDRILVITTKELMRYIADKARLQEKRD